MSTDHDTDGSAQPAFDVNVPHSARMYDYWLGGRDNYPADREMAEIFLQQIPSLREMAHANRDFMGRATRFLVAQGVRQFLDIGTGIPTSPNLHEIARGEDPSVRVVYSDNDPIVLAHARALMADAPSDAVAFLDGDLRDVPALLASPDLTTMLDLDRPVALTLIAVLMLIADEADPGRSIEALRDAVPSGSYLAISHPTQDFAPDVMAAVTAAATGGGMTFVPRTKAAVEAFFGDWELVDPGVVPVLQWRPDSAPDDPHAAYYWAGVARKP
jgi:SAM-dependent methyltransferase